MMVRQGDILLKLVQSLPKTADRKEEGCILAHGEATGHTHHVNDGAEIWVDVNENGRRYLKVLNDTSLDHEEHGHIALTRGIYEIVRQREYTPEAIRTVAD
jgi:hypothetical protein